MDSSTLWNYRCTVLECFDVGRIVLISASADIHRLITLFLYMVAELSALQQIITTLTGLNGLPVVIVECAVTTIYTSLGGFKVSFRTDVVQGAMVVLLIIIGVISVGVNVDVDRTLVRSSGLLEPSLLGWQLIYILPIAILTNDFFLSGFWMRTFASKTDKDLRIGVSIATVTVAIILILVGASGLLAVWSGALTDPETEGSVAFSSCSNPTSMGHWDHISYGGLPVHRFL